MASKALARHGHHGTHHGHSKTVSSFAKRVHAGAKEAVAKVGKAAGSLVARERSSGDSIGAIAGKALPKAGAAIAAGTMDRSETGQKFEELTGGLIRPSDALTAVGVIVRAANLDSGSDTLRGANTAFIDQQIVNWGRNVGERIPGVFDKFLDRRGGAKTSGIEEEIEEATGDAGAPPGGAGDTERAPDPEARTET